jgi:hypothetical protein
MPNLADVIQNIRIRIGDYDASNQRYNDDFIKRIISMALSSTPLNNLITNLFINGDDFNRVITPAEENLIAIKSHLQYLYSLKTTTDRDNISITKGRLRIDNTQQSRDIANSITMVEEEFNKALYYSFGVSGVRVE